MQRMQNTQGTSIKHLQGIGQQTNEKNKLQSKIIEQLTDKLIHCQISNNDTIARGVETLFSKAQVANGEFSMFENSLGASLKQNDDISPDENNKLQNFYMKIADKELLDNLGVLLAQNDTTVAEIKQACQTNCAIQLQCFINEPKTEQKNESTTEQKKETKYAAPLFNKVIGETILWFLNPQERNQLYVINKNTNLKLHEIANGNSTVIGNKDLKLSFKVASNPQKFAYFLKLIKNPRLSANLQTLDCSYVGLKDKQLQQILEALAESKHPEKLTSLNLSGNQISQNGIEMLANAKQLQNLTNLNLEITWLTPKCIKIIAQSVYLINLEVLNLGGNQIGNSAAETIAGSANFTNLTNLNLKLCSIGPAGAKAIAESENLINLTRLSLASNALGDDGATAIAEPVHFLLKELDLAGCDVGHAGVATIANSVKMKGLTRLNLGYNQLDSTAIKLIVNSKNLQGLRALILKSNDISDHSVGIIAESGLALTELNLSDNEIGQVGAEAIIASKNLQGLKILILKYNAIDDSTAKKIKQALKLDVFVYKQTRPMDN